MMASLFNPHLFFVMRRTFQCIAVTILLVIWFTMSTASTFAASKPGMVAGNISTTTPKLVIGTTSSLQNQHAPYRCLDADTNTMANNGTKVQLWDCNGQPQQNWVAYYSNNGIWIIQNQHYPYRCLDADTNTMANNGTKVQLWDCNGQPQQGWTISYDANGNLTFQSQHYPYRCLDADTNTMANNGTKVQLWDCNGQPQQAWK